MLVLSDVETLLRRRYLFLRQQVRHFQAGQVAQSGLKMPHLLPKKQIPPPKEGLNVAEDRHEGVGTG
jgi:hypothetical protein